MSWCQRHCRAPYKIKKRQKPRKSVVAGRQQLYCEVQSWSPNHRRITTEKVQQTAVNELGNLIIDCTVCKSNDTEYVSQLKSYSYNGLYHAFGELKIVWSLTTPSWYSSSLHIVGQCMTIGKYTDVTEFIVSPKNRSGFRPNDFCFSLRRVCQKMVKQCLLSVLQYLKVDSKKIASESPASLILYLIFIFVEISTPC